MASVVYDGPWWPGAEVAHLLDLGVFEKGVAKDVPDDRLGSLRDNPDFVVDGQRAQVTPAAPEPEVHTTAGDNQPTVPDPAPAAPAPAEGN